MFYVLFHTFLIHLPPAHINHLTEAHIMILSSEYNSLYFIRKYDYLK